MRNIEYLQSDEPIFEDSEFCSVCNTIENVDFWRGTPICKDCFSNWKTHKTKSGEVTRCGIYISLKTRSYSHKIKVIQGFAQELEEFLQTHNIPYNPENIAVRYADRDFDRKNMVTITVPGTWQALRKDDDFIN